MVLKILIHYRLYRFSQIEFQFVNDCICINLNNLLSCRHTFQPDDGPRQINDDKSYPLLLVIRLQRYRLIWNYQV